MGDTEPLRRTRLPDGRELVVREVVDADLPGLRALYDGLDDDARYRRFFSLYRPGDRFFERMLAAPERGGACLVVTVGEEDDAAEVVAEAGYEPLPDGDAELAMAVSAGWRGWLGAYLLDALLDHAAAHGFPNLEADVLITNRPMLSLLRGRRWATMPRTEWTVLRGVVGAAQPDPAWPPRRAGRRVLLEGGSGRWPAEDEAESAGLEVIACAGPGTCRRQCPLLAGRSCPLVEGADAIVMTGSTTGPEWDAIRAAHRREHPEVPVVVEPGTRSTRSRGVRPLLNAVEEALAERRGHEGSDPS